MSDADIVFQLYGVTATKDQDRETIKGIAGIKFWKVRKDPEALEARKWLNAVKIPEKDETEFDRLRKQVKKIIYDIRLARERGAPKKKSGRPKGSKDSFQRKRPEGLRYAMNPEVYNSGGLFVPLVAGSSPEKFFTRNKDGERLRGTYAR